MFVTDLESLNMRGIGLVVFAALLNHSCEPNAHYFFEGLELRARSLRAIEAGEEILVSYTDESFDHGFRQWKLNYRFFFVCKCT